MRKRHLVAKPTVVNNKLAVVPTCFRSRSLSLFRPYAIRATSGLFAVTSNLPLHLIAGAFVDTFRNKGQVVRHTFDVADKVDKHAIAFGVALALV